MMKTTILMSIVSALMPFMISCYHMTRQPVPDIGFHRWVKEEYAKHGVDLDKNDPIVAQYSRGKHRLPEEPGMVYRDHTKRTYLYGENTPSRRDAVIQALRKRSKNVMLHRAQIFYYKEYRETGDNEPYLIEKFQPRQSKIMASKIINRE